MILLAGMLMAIACAGILYSVIDQLGGATANNRKTMEERIGTLRLLSPSITVEKKNELSQIKGLNQFLKKQPVIQKLCQILEMTGWKISAGIFVLSALLGGSFCYLFLLYIARLPFILAAIISIALTGLIPLVIIRIKREKYLDQFSLQFPRGIQMIRGALGAGLGLSSAFERAAIDAPYPVNVEFKRIIDQMSLGQSLSDALSGFSKRVPTSDVKTFTIAISIQQFSGGNLTELMENLEETIYARATLRKELKVLTAQARMSGWVIGLLPPILMLLIQIVNPTYLSFLVATDEGKKMLAMTGLLQLIGFAFIKKIVSVRILT